MTSSRSEGTNARAMAPSPPLNVWYFSEPGIADRRRSLQMKVFARTGSLQSYGCAKTGALILWRADRRAQTTSRMYSVQAGVLRNSRISSRTCSRCWRRAKHIPLYAPASNGTSGGMTAISHSCASCRKRNCSSFITMRDRLAILEFLWMTLPSRPRKNFIHFLERLRLGFNSERCK